jgi:hypothetical protein
LRSGAEIFDERALDDLGLEALGGSPLVASAQA